MEAARGQEGPLGHTVAGGALRRPRSAWVHLIVVAIVLGIVVAVLYGPAIDDPLVADDWLLIDDASHGLRSIFLPNPERGAGEFHYLPLQKLVLFGVLKVAGIEAAAYHAVVIALGWGCAVLVCALGWQLSGELRIGAVAGLLFVTFGTTFVPFVWAGPGVAYTLSSLLYVAGVILFVRYQQLRATGQPALLAYLGFLGALILAPLAHEQGLTLIGACALYRFFVVDAGALPVRGQIKERVRAWMQDFGIPALLVGGYLAASLTVLGLGERDVRTSPTLAIDMGERIGLGMVRGLIPGMSQVQAQSVVFHLEGLTGLLFGPGRVGAVALLVAVVAGVLLLVGRFGSAVVRFLLTWLVLLVLAVSLVVNSPTPSRHLLLISVPGSLLWSLFAWGLVRRAGPVALAGPWSRMLPTALVVLALAIPGALFARSHVALWGAEVGHAKQLVDEVDRLVAASPSAETLTLIDFPVQRQLNSGELVPLFRVYSLAPWARLRYPGRFEAVTPAYTALDPDNFPRFRERAADGEFRWTYQLAEQPEASSDLRLEYSWKESGIAPWSPPVLTDTRTLEGGTVAEIDIDPGLEQTSRERITVRPGDPLIVSGWAIDQRADGPASDVFLTLDGELRVWGKYGAERPDVVARLQDPAFLRSGFLITVPADLLMAGEHRLELGVVAADRETTYRIPLPETVTVRAAPGDRGGGRSSPDQKSPAVPTVAPDESRPGRKRATPQPAREKRRERSSESTRQTSERPTIAVVRQATGSDLMARRETRQIGAGPADLDEESSVRDSRAALKRHDGQWLESSSRREFSPAA